MIQKTKGMTNEQKSEIARLGNEYITSKGLTAAAFSKVCDVNSSYLSNILNGVFTTSSGNNTVDIPDKYFAQIAHVVGYALTKVYWPHIHTREFVELVSELKAGKLLHEAKALIVDTGAGKTYAVKEFRRVNPMHTYVITMHSLLTINDLFNELQNQMNIPNKGSKGYKRAQIIVKLREQRKDGNNPLVIIDEAENMNPQMMRMIKGFYDGVDKCASIVLIGTQQLEDQMNDFKNKDSQGGPQFYRRFKSGKKKIRIEQSKEKRYAPFFDAIGIADKAFRKLLCETCDNYGELHDYLEPAIRKADEKGVALNEAFFRLMYDMAA